MKIRVLLFLGVLFFWSSLLNAQSWVETQSIFPQSQTSLNREQIAMSGDLIVLSKDTNRLNGEVDCRSLVMVYRKENNLWVVKDTLVVNKGENSSKCSFGVNSIAISENQDFIVLGCSSVDDVNIGAAFVFQRKNEKWEKVAKLRPFDVEYTFIFGNSVAIYGDIIVVTDPYVYDSQNATSGAAFIYQRINNEWKQLKKLAPSYEGHFGEDVAIHGNKIVISAPDEHIYSSNYTRGAVYTYNYLNGNVFFDSKITIDNGANFGNSVAIYGNFLAVGDFENYTNQISYGGAVFVYIRENGKWNFYQKISPKTSEKYLNFGRSVDIFKNQIIVGSAGEYSPAFEGYLGVGYIYQLNDGHWLETHKFFPKIPDMPNHSIGFANKVAMSEKYALICSPSLVFIYQDTTQTSNKIKGKIYVDSNLNCQKDTNERVSDIEIFIKAEPGPYYASVNGKGEYEIEVGKGTYTVSQILPNSQTIIAKQLCPTQPYQVTFTDINQEKTGLDFANQITECSLLKVDVAASRRLRCFPSQTTITYCNEGLITANNAVVEVRFPEYIIPKSSSLPWVKKGENLYSFNVGNIAPGECKNILIADSVACADNIMGLTQCVEARISPKSNCGANTPTWTGATISVSGTCNLSGSAPKALFMIKNTGSADMNTLQAYRIFANEDILYEGQIQLKKGDSLRLEVPTSNQSIRLEVNQVPNHPDGKTVSASVEGCGVVNLTANAAVALRFADDNQELEFEKFCAPIIGSYDPNDKQVSPLGVTQNRYVPVGSTLDYLIRFQNVGTAEAINIVVVDTLSEHLAMEKFEMMSASHPYELSISGKGRPILTWTFKNINLPDSTSNEPGSHGFIKFKISHKPEVVQGTKIENYADIYFDYNEPIRTNVTSNIILNYEFPKKLVNFCTLVRPAQVGNDLLTCQAKITLNGNIPTYGKGKWLKVKGLGTFKNENDPQSEVLNLGIGENIFKWTIACPECPTSEATLKIVRLAPPTIAQAGANREVCETSTQLAGNQALSGQGKWKIIQGSAKIQNVNAHNSLVTDLAYGETILRWSIGNGLCDSTHSEVKITRWREPSTAQAGVNQEICESNTPINANIPQFGQGKWRVKQGKATFANPFSAQTQVSNLAFGETILEWVIGNGVCDSTRSSLIIKRLEPIETKISFTSDMPNNFICSGISVTFRATAVNGGTQPQFQWKINGKTVGENANQLIVNDLQNNDVVTVELKANVKCPSPGIAVAEAMKITVLPTPLQPAIKHQELDKLTTSIQGTKYEWYHNGQLLPQNTPTISIKQLGNYELRVWEGACQSPKSKIFALDAEALSKFADKIQARISPNPNSGKFKLQIINNQGNRIELQITNQWGKIIQSQSIAGETTIDFVQNLDLSHLENGIYFIKINNQNLNTSQKIVIQK
jgi:uncharacterized repeat protein (TIGR01451 family)